MQLHPPLGTIASRAKNTKTSPVKGALINIYTSTMDQMTMTSVKEVAQSDKAI